MMLHRSSLGQAKHAVTRCHTKHCSSNLSLISYFFHLQEPQRKRARLRSTSAGRAGVRTGGGGGSAGPSGAASSAGGTGGGSGGGAIIESMHHHGRGVYSGTFSGTLNPALQVITLII